jgi:hypothetical protein
MTAMTDHTLWPRHTIHFPAFFAALVLAPLLVTAFTFWLIIPIFALVVGGPIYLVLGTPTLMWMLSRGWSGASTIALMAAFANVAACLAAIGLAQLAGLPKTAEAAPAFLSFGLIFAPLWGATFGWLYSSFTKTRN